MIKSKLIYVEDQPEYQSGVGILLYLVKHSWPDIANMTKKILKANNGAKTAASKELLHVIKHVLDMKNLVLKIELTGNTN